MPLSEKTKDMLMTRMAVLPEQLSNLLQDERLERFIETVHSAHNLTDVQSARVSDEVTLTLLLFEPLQDLAKNIERSAGVEKQIAEKITDSVRYELLFDDLVSLITNINAEQEKGMGVDLNPQNNNKENTESEVNKENLLAVSTDEVQDVDQKQSKEKPQSANPNSISPLRTMQSDAERIHGYGAYRRQHPQDADAPKPGSTLKPLSDLPRYENNERDSE